MNANQSSGLIEKVGNIHIIGICGVATSALAIAFHKKGWRVSGSDKGFYPPVSTALEEAGIPFYAGWHPEKIEEMHKGGSNESDLPDFIVAGGGGTSLSNPEIIFAKERGIEVLSFAQALGKFFIKENSIVTVGTWGKTTTSAMLSFILLRADFDPSYFTGGLSLSHDTGRISDSDWSVVEGDEYQAAIWDKRPKFAYYSPTHLLLTSVAWDHADLYPTEKAYFEEFENLIAKIPPSGMIVCCSDDPGVQKVMSTATQAKSITYGTTNSPTYIYDTVTHTKAGISFTIRHAQESFKITSPMLGTFNAENIAGCFALAHSIGIASEKIITAIADFKGIKRRLEKRYGNDDESNVTILDCHAPTGDKVASVLKSIREVYRKKIIAIFEPNIGGRQKSSITMYDEAFRDADMLFLPHFTKLKIDPNEAEHPLEAPDLVHYISKQKSNATKSITYIEDDTELIEKAVAATEPGDVIVFLGSHGFRGMIEEAIAKVT